MSYADDYLDDRMHEEAARGSGSWLDPEQDEEPDERRERCGTCGGCGVVKSTMEPPEVFHTRTCPACRPDKEDEDAE